MAASQGFNLLWTKGWEHCLARGFVWADRPRVERERGRIEGISRHLSGDVERKATGWQLKHEREMKIQNRMFPPPLTILHR